MVDLGSLICLLSLAVQALKLGMLGFIIIGDVGRERRERSYWQGWEGRCCSWTSEWDIVSALSR